MYVPYISVAWVLLAQAIVAIQNRWWQRLRWGTVGIALWLSINQFFISPAYAFQHPKPTLWPNEAVIDEMITTTPFLKSNLGMVVNTIQINPFNLDFYGAIANFQVFARQLSFSPHTVEQDSQALDWYLTKTQDQGVYDHIEAGQQQLRETIEAAVELPIHKTWPLPDGSELRLHHRQNPPITVKPLAPIKPPQSKPPQSKPPQISLAEVNTVSSVFPGQSYPITYRVRGSGAALEPGLLLLSWQSVNNAANDLWISDHAIGLGYLNTRKQASRAFEVIETLSLHVPADIPTGTYRLQAEYLNRQTRAHYRLSDSAAQVTVIANAPSPEQNVLQNGTPDLAPDLSFAQSPDLLSVLHYQLAPKLMAGEIDPLFAEIGRINQYDPLQDYLVQAEQAMTYRLSQSTNHADWLYTLALAQVLQQRPQVRSQLSTP
ncbi:MAG: hypothetical protein HC800_04285 [Phormidesmis sp. RL_2_1]|nr:hypothetical protein [Phormidesmis sp. RL_2_1]